MKKKMTGLLCWLAAAGSVSAYDSVDALISAAENFDLENIDREIRYRRVPMDKETVQLGTVKTLMRAANLENAAIVRVRYPHYRYLARYRGDLVKTLPWYEAAFRRGGTVYRVLETYKGTVPEDILILVREGESYLDEIYNIPRGRGVEMIVAIVPFEGDEKLSKHPIIYEIYGKALFNSIVVGWSEGLDFEPKYGGKFEEDIAEAIIRRVLDEEPIPKLN